MTSRRRMVPPAAAPLPQNDRGAGPPPPAPPPRSAPTPAPLPHNDVVLVRPPPRSRPPLPGAQPLQRRAAKSSLSGLPLYAARHAAPGSQIWRAGRIVRVPGARRSRRGSRAADARARPRRRRIVTGSWRLALARGSMQLRTFSLPPPTAAHRRRRRRR